MQLNYVTSKFNHPDSPHACTIDFVWYLIVEELDEFTAWRLGKLGNRFDFGLELPSAWRLFHGARRDAATLCWRSSWLWLEERAGEMVRGEGLGERGEGGRE